MEGPWQRGDARGRAGPTATRPSAPRRRPFRWTRGQRCPEGGVGASVWAPPCGHSMAGRTLDTGALESSSSSERAHCLPGAGAGEPGRGRAEVPGGSRENEAGPGRRAVDAAVSGSGSPECRGRELQSLAAQSPWGPRSPAASRGPVGGGNRGARGHQEAPWAEEVLGRQRAPLPLWAEG